MEGGGKMLILSWSGDRYLLIHLKMTGQLVLRQPRKGLVVGGHPIKNVETVPNKFTHVEIVFGSGLVLYFNDVRKFGWLKLVDADGLAKATAPYGPEPLDKLFSQSHWLELLKKKRNLSIKKALLDQSLVAGLGNIYVDEACFYTGIRPTRRISSLSRQQRLDLFRNVQKVLRLSIRQGGTSFNTYRQAHGGKGNFYKFLKVYGRVGQPCRSCGTLIKKIRHAGRGTQFCPHCQK